jgi:hypothetical protein
MECSGAFNGLALQPHRGACQSSLESCCFQQWHTSTHASAQDGTYRHGAQRLRVSALARYTETTLGRWLAPLPLQISISQNMGIDMAVYAFNSYGTLTSNPIRQSLHYQPKIKPMRLLSKLGSALVAENCTACIMKVGYSCRSTQKSKLFKGNYKQRSLMCTACGTHVLVLFSQHLNISECVGTSHRHCCGC